MTPPFAWSYTIGVPEQALGWLARASELVYYGELQSVPGMIEGDIKYGDQEFVSKRV